MGSIVCSFPQLTESCQVGHKVAVNWEQYCDKQVRLYRCMVV